jgi:hypothetical protein
MSDVTQLSGRGLAVATWHLCAPQPYCVVVHARVVWFGLTESLPGDGWCVWCTQQSSVLL